MMRARSTLHHPSTNEGVTSMAKKDGGLGKPLVAAAKKKTAKKAAKKR
jgi:hypothetical protein